MIKDYDLSYNDCKTYYEFFSSFLERMMLLFLKGYRIYNNDVNDSNNKYLSQLKKYSDNLLKYLDKDKNAIINNKHIITPSMIYFYGEYLALIKEYDYMRNQFETKNRIKEYLKYRGSINKDEELEILGISHSDLYSGEKVKQLLLRY